MKELQEKQGLTGSVSNRATLSYPRCLLIGLGSILLWELSLSINGIRSIGDLFRGASSRWYTQDVVATSSNEFEWSKVG